MLEASKDRKYRQNFRTIEQTEQKYMTFLQGDPTVAGGSHPIWVNREKVRKYFLLFLGFSFCPMLPFFLDPFCYQVSNQNLKKVGENFDIGYL